MKFSFNTCKHHHAETIFIFKCPCLDLRLFMSYPCHLFFIFIFIFIMINRVISWEKTRLLLWLFFEISLDDNVVEKCEQLSNSLSSASGSCLAFASFFANFNLELLIKMLFIKKACIISIHFHVTYVHSWVS